MGIKRDPVTNTWTVSYSKRPKPKMPPISRRAVGIGSEKEAQKVLKRLITEVHEKAAEKLSPFWVNVVNEYFDNCLMRGISQRTVDNSRFSINAHTKPWDKCRVDQITTKEILDIINIKLAETSSGNKYFVLKVLRQIFKFAIEQGWINRNPTPKLIFKKQLKLMGVLTKDQTERFLNMARELDSPWYSIWIMALYTGMRNGELFALTWDKVDLENGFIKVDTAWNNKDGFKSTKSGCDRILEIAPDLMYVLKQLKLKNDGVPFVLPRVSKWEKGEQARELRMFLMGLNLPQIRFHDLRATWATLLLSSGVESIKVMKMGGWQNIETMQIYIRKAGVDIKGAMNGFSLFNPSSVECKVIRSQFGSSS